MNTHFSIEQGDVHVWRVFLSPLIKHASDLLAILSPDEIERANRFRFAKHRDYFVMTRGILRHLLNLYTDISPEKIVFSYGSHGKPYIALSPIHFNISHSHEMALYGFTQNKAIGIDIEKIKSTVNLDIAKRFFSPDEYQYLLSLPEREKIKAFYAIWARKEALIKALGKGLYTPLNHFSSLSSASNLSSPLSNAVTLKENNQEYLFHVKNVMVHPDYQAAVAATLPIEKMCFWEWREGPVEWDDFKL
jgi:4'-phosphopantetheinyl transferase